MQVRKFTLPLLLVINVSACATTPPTYMNEGVGKRRDRPAFEQDNEHKENVNNMVETHPYIIIFHAFTNVLRLF